MSADIGGIASGIASAYGAYSTNKANREIAAKQMRFQERMSSTAYQRAKKDLEAAGMNPMLAYMSGSASTPSGAGISQQDPITPAINSAISARRAYADVRNLEEQNKQIRSTTALNLAQAAAASEASISRQNQNVKSGIEADLYRLVGDIVTPVSTSAKDVISKWKQPIKKVEPRRGLWNPFSRPGTQTYFWESLKRGFNPGKR